jgi:DNA-directed RNA polymerase specialized sigma24 family protein
LNKQAYREAWGYTYKLRRSDNVDIVHDAYIRWYDTTGRDLFDEHRGTIARALRYSYLKSMSRTTFKYKGESFVRHYRSKDDINADDIPAHEFVTHDTPFDTLITEESENLIKHSLSPGQLRVYSYFKQGYNTQEVADELGMTRNGAGRHFHDIREVMLKLVA